MEKLLMNILSLGLKPFYEKNIAYYKLVKEFRDKLPRHQNQAKKLTEEEIQKNPMIPESAKYMNVVDLSTLKSNVSESDIDLFYNRINDFNYSLVVFKKHYKAFTANLNRLKPNAKGNLDLVVLQKVLQDDPLHPLKPLDILTFKLKWKYKMSSNIYIWYTNKNKKLG